MSWIHYAVCKNDKHRSRWLSFNLEDIEYAKEGCKKCPVIERCAMSLGEEMGIGVMFGLSEYDRLCLSIDQG